MLFWVPVPEVAAVLAGVPDAEVRVVAPDGGPLPASADEVEFYVPPFFPGQPAVEVITRLPGLRVVQTLTAGIDRFLPYLPPGVTLCNARGVHDASTAEWVVAAILAAERDLPYFAREQAGQRWSYRFTGNLAGKTVRNHVPNISARLQVTDDPRQSPASQGRAHRKRTSHNHRGTMPAARPGCSVVLPFPRPRSQRGAQSRQARKREPGLR